MSEELLNNLRDIHLPAEPGWWPLAIGWWIIIVLAFIIISTLLFIQYNKHKAKQAQVNSKPVFSIQFYKDQLANIKKQYQQDQNNLELIQATSMLLRKFCIAHSADAAQLTEQAWLQHLDNTFKTHHFSTLYSDTLTKSNYAPSGSLKNADIKSDEFIRFIDDCFNSYSALANREEVNA